MADRKTKNKKFYDLVILGSGSASFAGAIRAAELGNQVAMIERATLGGTCVNVGCIPSKTLIRVAETKHRAENSRFQGVSPKGTELDFAGVIHEKDMLVQSMRQNKYRHVLDSYDSIELIEGDASFVSENEVRVGNRIIGGEHFLIATGSSPYAPSVPGLDAVGYLTSTTAFELTKLPSSMIVIGGRYIALELAQMFQRLGSRVTVLQRSDRILPTEDPDLTDALQHYLEQEGVTILTGVHLVSVLKDNAFRVEFERNGKTQHLDSEQLVVATGRRPNTSGLNLQGIGVDTNKDGSIKTDSYCRTTLSHIYAAGDVIGNPAFVYTAAYEGKLAADNAFDSNARKRDYSLVPSVIFTDPQVARIGPNERDAEAKGMEVEIARLDLEHLPRALAARDTRGFIKLLKKKGDDHLVGATILAPEGSELLMEVAMAIKYEIPISDMAAMFHPYLTLSEGIKLTAQMFSKDIQKLSCCAV